LSNSKYGDTHRFIGVASKNGNTVQMTNGLPLFLHFEYARERFNYGGDVNLELNDLIYVPITAEINTMVFSGKDKGTLMLLSIKINI
jgi:hypothetical protein